MVAKEVILLGTGNSRDQCPYDCEVWGVNGAYMVCRIGLDEGLFRMDKLFITDDLFSAEGNLQFDIMNLNKYINEYNAEVISLKPIKLGKYEAKTKRYPWKRIARKFNTAYFTSTICYMIAYLLDKHTTKNTDSLAPLKLTQPLKIRMYGVDMANQKEYLLQKGGVEFWLSYAMALGCEVEISEGSAVLVPGELVPYGHKMILDMTHVDPYNLLGGKGG